MSTDTLVSVNALYQVVGKHGVIVRGTVDIRSPQVGVLPKDQIVSVIEKCGRRVHMSSPLDGWCSVKTGGGQTLLEPCPSFTEGEEVEAKAKGPNWTILCDEEYCVARVNQNLANGQYVITLSDGRSVVASVSRLRAIQKAPVEKRDLDERDSQSASREPTPTPPTKAEPETQAPAPAVSQPATTYQDQYQQQYQQYDQTQYTQQYQQYQQVPVSQPASTAPAVEAQPEAVPEAPTNPADAYSNLKHPLWDWLSELDKTLQTVPGITGADPVKISDYYDLSAKAWKINDLLEDIGGTRDELEEAGFTINDFNGYDFEVAAVSNGEPLGYYLACKIDKWDPTETCSITCEEDLTKGSGIKTAFIRKRRPENGGLISKPATVATLAAKQATTEGVEAPAPAAEQMDEDTPEAASAMEVVEEDTAEADPADAFMANAVEYDDAQKAAQQAAQVQAPAPEPEPEPEPQVDLAAQQKAEEDGKAAEAARAAELEAEQKRRAAETAKLEEEAQKKAEFEAEEAKQRAEENMKHQLLAKKAAARRAKRAAMEKQKQEKAAKEAEEAKKEARRQKKEAAAKKKAEEESSKRAEIERLTRLKATLELENKRKAEAKRKAEEAKKEEEAEKRRKAEEEAKKEKERQEEEAAKLKARLEEEAQKKAEKQAEEDRKRQAELQKQIEEEKEKNRILKQQQEERAKAKEAERLRKEEERTKRKEEEQAKLLAQRKKEEEQDKIRREAEKKRQEEESKRKEMELRKKLEEEQEKNRELKRKREERAKRLEEERQRKEKEAEEKRKQQELILKRKREQEAAVQRMKKKMKTMNFQEYKEFVTSESGETDPIYALMYQNRLLMTEVFSLKQQLQNVTVSQSRIEQSFASGRKVIPPPQPKQRTTSASSKLAAPKQASTRQTQTVMVDIHLTYAKKRAWGFGCSQKYPIKVSKLKDGQAMEMGMKLHDIVHKVNNAEVTEDTWKELFKSLMSGNNVDLTLKREVKADASRTSGGRRRKSSSDRAAKRAKTEPSVW